MRKQKSSKQQVATMSESKLDEMMNIWKKPAELPAKTKPGEALFVFYRVLEKWDFDPKSGWQTLRCDPFFQRSPAKATDLAKVCANEYGGGKYVALEVSENVDGHPLSYWVVKIISRKQCTAKQVFHDQEELSGQRQIHFLIPTEEKGVMTLDKGRRFFETSIFGEDVFFAQLGSEAALTAKFLKELPDPEIRKEIARRIKKRGMQPQPEVNMAYKLWIERLPEEEIKQKLLNEFRLTSWTKYDDWHAEEAANRAIKAAKKREQREKKRRKKNS